MSQLHLTIISALPEAVHGYLGAGVLGRGIAEGRLRVDVSDLRGFGEGKHRRIDDYPYGGGQGMVLAPGPLVAAIEQALQEGPGRAVVLTSPAGSPLTAGRARSWSEGPGVILVCGRYEGVDERVMAWIDEELSLGDFVLTGGELAALAAVDAVARLLPGVLGNEASAAHESFEDGVLEHPQYTRPRDFRGREVPSVLLSGDHGKVAAWRAEQARERTARRRPDLIPPRRSTGSFSPDPADPLDGSGDSV